MAQPSIDESRSSEPAGPVPFSLSTPFWTVASLDGLATWEARRRRWLSTEALSPEENQKLAERRRSGKIWHGKYSFAGTPRNMEKVFRTSVVNWTPFVRPINLQEIIPIMIAGWQMDGTWPKDQVAPRNSE